VRHISNDLADVRSGRTENVRRKLGWILFASLLGALIGRAFARAAGIAQLIGPMDIRQGYYPEAVAMKPAKPR
jgi:hypothetical protein